MGLGIPRGVFGGGAGRLIGERQAVDVENAAPFEKGPVDLRPIERNIRLMAPIEREIALPIRLEGDKRQCRAAGRIDDHPGDVHPGVPEPIPRETAVRVVADLADKRGRCAESRCRRRQIDRTAARILDISWIPDGGKPIGGKVDEDLAQRADRK